MTVKVIKEPKPKKCVCDECKSTLSYEYSDIETTTVTTQVDGTETFGYIICPKCKNDINVSYS